MEDKKSIEVTATGLYMISAQVKKKKNRIIFKVIYNNFHKSLSYLDFLFWRANKLFILDIIKFRR